jgi:eukaryotic-like serine/threonine-protein kinase
MTSPERWRALQDVVDGALDRPAVERAAFLNQECRHDAELHRQAVRLLAACQRADAAAGLLSESALAFAGPLLSEVAAIDAEQSALHHAAQLATLRTALAGSYDVQQEIGRGGMATVYRARDCRHDRAVAIKVVDARVAHAHAARFLREIRTTARLTHPHIVGIHDSGDAAGLLYYVMPFVPAETLRERMRREGVLPLTDAVRLMREIADALACAHGEGVIHCDLKPENVLLSSGHAVVADFGIARALAVAADAAAEAPAAPEPHSALLTTMIGTPAYMAPEQASPGAALDHRADLYALGVIAYEMLTGEHPFAAHGDTGESAVRRPVAVRPLHARRRDVPPALDAVIMQLLAADAASRPPSAADVLHALHDRAVTAGRHIASRTRVLALAAAALLLTVALSGYLLTRRADSEQALPATAASSARSVAVLPFENAGSTVDGYFSDGITDELAHAIARLDGVHVAGRASSYVWRSTTATPQEIGRALSVAMLVTGRVRRDTDRTRVSTQLVRVSDGMIIWANDVEVASADALSVHDELGAAVVAAVNAALGTSAGTGADAPGGRGTTDAEAYDLYLKGRYHFLERGADNVARAIDFFERATARDRGFARAHAALALAFGVLPSYVEGSADSAAVLVAASARRAVALDAELADAQVAQGIAHENALRFDLAESSYRAAIALEPSNVMAHHALGMMLAVTGRADEAIPQLQRATRLDPFAKSAATALVGALTAARRFTEASAEVRRVLAMDSTFQLALLALGTVQAFSGQPDSAIHTLERGLRMHPQGSGFVLLLYAYAASGRWSDVHRLRDSLRASGGDRTGGANAAFAEMLLGDAEPMITLLTTRDGQFQWLFTGVSFGCNHLLDPLWSDARFVAAMRAIHVRPCVSPRPWPFRPPPPADR